MFDNRKLTDKRVPQFGLIANGLIAKNVIKIRLDFSSSFLILPWKIALHSPAEWLYGSGVFSIVVNGRNY